MSQVEGDFLGVGGGIGNWGGCRDLGHPARLPSVLRQWSARPDVTVGRGICQSGGNLPGPCSVVSHPPKIAAGWGSLGRDDAWASPPYHYFGCFDDIDYSRISHKGNRYNIRDLERALIIPKRDRAILSKWNEKACGKATVAFCCTHEHARRVAASFARAGVPAAPYISETSARERGELLDKLANGDIKVLCTVDVFNEGADLPFIECLLFLRPTESKRIFYQQLGRGLRQYAGKTYCTVIDFIGNFHNAYKIVEYQSLQPFEESDLIPDLRHARSRKDVLNLPLNCEVHFDEKVVKVFADQAFDPRHATRHNIGKILMYEYDKLRDHLGHRPTKREVDRYSILNSLFYIQVFGSWPAFESLVQSDSPA
jgi:hypothetical protein